VLSATTRGIRACHYAGSGRVRHQRTGNHRGHHHRPSPAAQPECPFSGGIRPHHYCLPILKRETHRQKLIEAATSGNAKFFLGTDSAPHAQSVKENACGCAGIYTAHAAIELYAEAFEQAGALEKLEAFASFHGADFYRLPRNRDRITLKKENWRVPAQLEFGDESLIPFRAGENVTWTLDKTGN
jgi:dihydroorotase